MAIFSMGDVGVFIFAGMTTICESVSELNSSSFVLRSGSCSLSSLPSCDSSELMISCSSGRLMTSSFSESDFRGDANLLAARILLISSKSSEEVSIRLSSLSRFQKSRSSDRVLS